MNKKQATGDKGKILKVLHSGFFVMVDTEKVKKTEAIELKENNSRIFTYVIMPRLGKNLDKLFKKIKAQFTK